MWVEFGGHITSENTKMLSSRNVDCDLLMLENMIMIVLILVH